MGYRWATVIGDTENVLGQRERERDVEGDWCRRRRDKLRGWSLFLNPEGFEIDTSIQPGNPSLGSRHRLRTPLT